MSSLSHDEIVAFCETFSEDKGSSALFDVLIDVAWAYVRLMQYEDKPDLSNPDSFRPATMGGITYREAALGGITDHMTDPTLIPHDIA